MPELPEAETIARGLRRSILGRRLGAVCFTRPDVLRNRGETPEIAVTGHRVAGVFRRGKRVLIKLDNDVTLVFALGMTGQLTVARTDTACPPHTHLRIALDRGARELRFRDVRRFGGVWFLKKGAMGEKSKGRALGPLGPEPLEIRIPQFRTLLRRKRRIKALLLDQSVIAGLGNIYCDEALHRASIHPVARADELTLDQSAALLRGIRAVLREAIRRGGSTLNDYRDANGKCQRRRFTRDRKESEQEYRRWVIEHYDDAADIVIRDGSGFKGDPVQTLPHIANAFIKHDEGRVRPDGSARQKGTITLRVFDDNRRQVVSILDWAEERLPMEEPRDTLASDGALVSP